VVAKSAAPAPAAAAKPAKKSASLFGDDSDDDDSILSGGAKLSVHSKAPYAASIGVQSSLSGLKVIP
jgi:hypothetical protein